MKVNVREEGARINMLCESQGRGLIQVETDSPAAAFSIFLTLGLACWRTRYLSALLAHSSLPPLGTAITSLSMPGLFPSHGLSELLCRPPTLDRHARSISTMPAIPTLRSQLKDLKGQTSGVIIQAVDVAGLAAQRDVVETADGKPPGGWVG